LKKKQDDDDVLRRVLGFKVNGELGRGPPRKIWRRQDGERNQKNWSVPKRCFE